MDLYILVYLSMCLYGSECVTFLIITLTGWGWCFMVQVDMEYWLSITC